MGSLSRLCILGLLAAFFILITAQPAFGQVSHAPLPVSAFQRAMIFIDGTNLFCRIRDMNVYVASFADLWRQALGRRDLVRTCCYTIKERVDKTIAVHGKDALKGITLFLGSGVVDGKGVLKEKGVDEMLVADLIYHAARKNIDYALLVSVDGDFTHAITRVHDFGCRTGVLALGIDAPEALRNACDDYQMLSKAELLKRHPSSIREIS